MALYTSKSTIAYLKPSGAIYAAPNGNAIAGNGLSESAPVSIGRALTLLPPTGGTIVLRDGTYATQIIINKPNTTLQAYPGESPEISGLAIVTGFTQSGDTWIKTGYDITHSALYIQENDVKAEFPQAGNKQKVFINDQILTQVAGVPGPGQFSVDEVNQTLTIGTSPIGKTVRVISKDTGIDVTRVNARIRGINIVGFATSGIIIRSSGQIIEDCSIVCCTHNIRLYTNDTVIRNNNLTHGGKSNIIGGWGSSGLVIEDNLIANGAIGGFNNAWGGSGLKILDALNPIIRRNIFKDNLSTSCWLDEHVRGALVYDNKCYRGAIAYFHEVSYESYFVNNLAVDCAAGLMSAISQDGHFYNNTIRNCKEPIVVKDGGRIDTRINARYGPQKSAHFVNNLIIGTRSNMYVKVQTYLQELSSQYIAVMKNNVYVTGTSTAKWGTWSNTTAQEKLYDTVASFRLANPNYEQNSVMVSTESSPRPQPSTVPAKIFELLGKQPGVIGSTLTIEEEGPMDPKDQIIADLQAEIFELQTAVQYANQTSQALQNQVNSLTTENANLKTQLAASTSPAERAQLVSQINALTAEKTSLQIALDTARADLTGLLTRVKTSLAAIDSLVHGEIAKF